MSYTPTTWVEGVTKLGPTNLNHLEQGVAAVANSGSSASVDVLRRSRKKLLTDPANYVVEMWGDSTAEEINYAFPFTRLRGYHALAGMALEGVTADATHIASKGNSGVALTSYLAGGVGTAGHQLADFQASTADLIVLRWLTNDTRLGARTKAQMEADMRTLIGLAPAGADIVITVPPTFTTTVVGSDYLSGASIATAQARWDAARAACYALTGDYQRVLVADPSLDVYGDRVALTSALMTDQLHPNQSGQEKWADWLAPIIGLAPTVRGQAIAPRQYQFEVLGQVSAAGNGFIDIDCLDDRLPHGKDWNLLTTDFLYIPGFATFPLQLTSATFPDSGNNVRILKGGTDFSGVAVKTIVAITGAGYLRQAIGRSVRWIQAITYSASMTPDASQGDLQTVNVTNNTAFTINAPTQPPNTTHTQDLMIEFTNGSGGAITNVSGATWNAAFVLIGGALTDPASTKKRYIRFAWNGAKWVETARASADY